MGEICLEWEDHAKVLTNKLWEFFKEEYLVDFTVTCHGQQKKVHKCILALLIPMLKEALGSGGTVLCCDQEKIAEDESLGEFSKKPAPQCLNLDHIARHPEDINYLTEFAYTGKTTVPKEHENCMLHIADIMGIKSLKKSICQWHYNGKRVEKSKHKHVATQCNLSQSWLTNYMSGSGNEVCVNNNNKEINPYVKVKEEKSEWRYRLKRIKSSKSDNFVSKTNFKTSPQKVTETDSTEETNDQIHENPSNEQKSSSTDDGSDENDVLDNDDTDYDTDCETETLTCKHCGYQTRKRAFFKRHIMSRHHMDMDGNVIEMNVKCTKCDFVCYTENELRAHERIKHERLRKYKCKECNFTTLKSSRFRNHERFAHKNIPKTKCHECGKWFRRNEFLKRHIIMKHMDLKPYICKICGMKYKLKKEFKMHMECHSNDEEYKYVCDTCGYRAKHHLVLSVHVQREHRID